MPCNISDFKLSAVCIELLDVNLHINVQDTFGSIVEDANISINCNGNIETGVTDEEGNYYGIVIPSVICSITITKDCLDTYTGKFILLDETEINDVSANFPMKVVNGSNVPVAGADVQITSGTDVQTGVTDSNGIFKGINPNDFQNTIQIQKSGFTTYAATIPSFIKVQSELTGYIVVPVITLT